MARARVCIDGDVKIADGPNEYEGRAEICYDGEWGTICDDDYHENTAYVICKQLNLPLNNSRSIVQYTGGTGPIHLINVVCVGNESNLLQCSYETLIDRPGYCLHLDDLGISCAPFCMENEVRLLRDRVQTCHNKVWNYVCRDIGWRDTDAAVVCRELGLSDEDAVASSEYFFETPAFPFFLNGTRCEGDEEHLSDCFQTSKISDCGKNFAAVVYCVENGPCPEEGALQLTPVYPNEDAIGRLEICHNGHWGSICNDFTAGSGIAPLACKQLGYSVPGITLTLGNFDVTLSKIPIILDDVRCTGSEQSLLECSNSGGVGVHNCVHYEDVVLDCRGCLETELRLFGGDNPSEGSVEMCIDNEWVPLCGQNWNTDYAALVCSQLGYDGTSHAGKEDGVADNAIIIDISCSVTESVFVDCISMEGTMSCEQNTTAVAFCSMDTSSGEETTELDSAAAGAISASLIVAFVGVFLVIAIVVIIYRQRKKRTWKKNTSEMTRIQSGGIDRTDIDTGFNAYALGTQAKVSHADAQRSRIDSHYLRELTSGKYLIKYDQLSQLENIGLGEYGIVYKAKLNRHGILSREVAVKTLKGCYDQMEVDNFVKESLKMSRFKHSHVMGLIGVCLDAGPAPYIVMPYMANGSVLQYLKRERSHLVLTQTFEDDEVEEVQKRLMVMCSQISSGMEYLAKEKYIHRDLAARNCMIDSHFLIKISDFGLSEDVFQRNYFREGLEGEDGVKLPVKWMAPESLSDGHFSEKSDVWSYGVVMWEIFSGGKAPYPGIDPLILVNRLEEGHRMPQPYNAACSEEIYTMMMKCWDIVPENRPCFKELYMITSKHIERIAGYLEMGFNPFVGERHATNCITEDSTSIEKEVSSPNEYVD